MAKTKDIEAVREIHLSSWKVDYVCESCKDEVRTTLGWAVARKDFGTFCATKQVHNSQMLVRLKSLPEIGRDYWKTRVNLLPS